MLIKLIKIGCGILWAVLGIWFAVTGNYIACVNLSVVLFFCPLLTMVGEWAARLFQKGLPTRNRQGLGNVALLYTVYLMAAACLLRYAVGGYVLAHPDALGEAAEWLNLRATAPSVGVQLVDAMLRAIRSIGIAEDYTAFIAALKATWSVAFPEGDVGRAIIVHYATLLNIAIPVAGSTLVLGMFAQIFPRFLLWLEYKNPFRREKCYFSGLNPQSVALAKSILLTEKAEGKWIMPLLVFTDAYVDDESEQSYELMLEAKRIGAICVRDDLSHVQKTAYGDCKYFLMEEEEYANLPTLMSLVEEHNAPFLKNATVYMFVQSDMHVRLEQNIRQRLMDKSRGKKALTESELPAIIPVNAHRNLVNNLMVDVPLYEPLVGTDKKELTVTILGNGSIGTEAFLSAYWFGRMMVAHTDKMGDEHVEECKLVIHVVSQDDEEAFWAKIDGINPDIRHTATPNDPLLAWREGAYNAPYCTVQYHKADAKAGRFTDGEADAASHEQQDPRWLDTDYVIVALGNDADNIAVANKLRADIGKRHLEGKGESVHTVIAYVVYNSDLCHALNTGARAEYGIYMRAFGDMDEVYGCNNVFMTKNQLLAEEAHKAYHGSDSIGRNGKHKKPSRTYEQLADMARAMHHKYKVFSLGWITTSLFTTEEEEHRKTVEMLRHRYKRVAVVGKMSVQDLYDEAVVLSAEEQESSVAARLLNADDYAKWKDLYRYRHVLAWLEHRRWSAYTRTMGYRSTDAMERYYLTEHGHKNMSLKLHPCLVEARPIEMGTKRTYVFTDEVFWKDAADDPWTMDENMDALDVHHVLRWRAMTAAWDVLLGMSLEAKKDADADERARVESRRQRIKDLRGRMAGRDHCKKYDYFIGEVAHYEVGSAFYAQMAHHLPIRPDRWEKQCKEWEACGAFFCPKGDEGEGEWLIPKDCLKEYVKHRFSLTLAVKAYSGTVEAGEIPAPFAFAYDGTYYAADTRKNRGLVQQMKDAYARQSEAELAAMLSAELAEKERNKTTARTEEA